MDSDVSNARAQQDRNVRRTVAVSALKRMHDLVDGWNAEALLARRMSIVGAALLCAAVAAVLVLLFGYRVG